MTQNARTTFWSGLTSGSKLFRKVTRTAMACSLGGLRPFAKRCGKDLSGKAFGLAWTRGIVCVFTHSIRGVECAKEVRAAWRALFLLDSEGGLTTMPGKETLGPFFEGSSRIPFFSAEILAKFALDLLAERKRNEAK